MARILGIDIDRGALRGALLKTAFRKTEVERYVQIPLTEVPGSPGRISELQGALANLWRACGKAPDFTVSSLDGEQASLRVLELPAAAGKRIVEVLPFELESMLPFDITEAVVDHQPIDVRGGLLHLLAAAALRDRVKNHLDLFAGSACDPREVAVGAAALDGLRLVCPELATGTVALLELCEYDANFCVLAQGRVTFARTLSAGADSLAKGGAELLQGIHRSLSAYSASGGPALDSLHLCGIGPLPELLPWLARELTLQVVVLTIPEATVPTTADLPVFARALALAARATTSGKRINLRKGEFATKRARNELVGQLNLAGVCAAAVLLTVVFTLWAQQSLLVSEQTALRARLGETTESIFGTAETDPQKVETLLASPHNENPLPRFDAYDALAAISDSIPEGMTHEVRHVRIDLADEKKEGQLEIQGTLASIEDRDKITSALEAHGCFNDLTRGRTSPGRSADQVNYQLEAKVLCPGDAQAKKKKKVRSSDE